MELTGMEGATVNVSEIPVDKGGQDDDAAVVTAIERSKVHWSQLPGDVPSQGGAFRYLRNLVPNRANVKIQQKNQASWKALQELDPIFFQDWSKKVKIGRKIAEGGQGDIFEASWKNRTSMDMVVKVFKMQGSSPLEDFIRLWPRIAPPSMSSEELGQAPQFLVTRSKFCDICWITGAYLLKDGKVAFLMPRYTCDLRSLIDNKMQENQGQGPPFSNVQDVVRILKHIAEGMRWLHGKGVLHRDLKASNVLVQQLDYHVFYYVADYECSVSTMGTGFWRAPEVLREMEHQCSPSENTWTTKSDVYSFAMTCFEVLTGSVPFPDHGKKDWTKIIDHGERPELPDYVDSELQELVKKCWDKDPLKRPPFDYICSELIKLEVKDSFGL